MRRFILISMAILISILACSKSRYGKNSKEYVFFSRLAEITPLMNPEKSQILIQTNKFKISTRDIMPIVYRVMSQYSAELSRIPKADIEQFIFQVATQEAEKRMLYAEAKAQHVKITPDSLQKQMERIFQNAGGKSRFLQDLITRGISFKEFKNELGIQLTIEKFLKEKLYDTVSVSEEEIQKYYNQDQRATVRHILLVTQNKSDSEKAALRQKMETIRTRALQGEDFAKLAREYSEDPGSKLNGGLYQNFERGDMVQPFDSIAFHLPIGKISEVFETPFGYHILKVIDRQKDKRPLEKIKPEMIQKLTQEKRVSAYTNLIQSLKLKYQYQVAWNPI